MRVPRRALGMYPDQTCFDTNRPSWLPYWLDDFTESSCKMNLLIAGNPTGNTAQPGQPGVDPGTVANAELACAAQSGTWDASTSVCKPDLLHQYGWWVLGGGVMVAMLLFGTAAVRR